MAHGQHSPNSETLGVAATPLMRKQTEAYVKNQKEADFNRNLSQYMFWGATSILGALAATIGLGGGLGALATISFNFLFQSFSLAIFFPGL